MRFQPVLFLSATFLAAMASFAAMAQVIQPFTPPPTVGVPGPIAGAGLVYFALAGGGYYLFRRWRKNRSGD